MYASVLLLLGRVYKVPDPEEKALGPALDVMKDAAGVRAPPQPNKADTNCLKLRCAGG